MAACTRQGDRCQQSGIEGGKRMFSERGQGRIAKKVWKQKVLPRQLVFKRIGREEGGGRGGQWVGRKDSSL